MTRRIEMEETARRRFADIAECFERPCIVNAPLLTQELLGRNASVRGFTDEDEFVELPGFRPWSISSPIYVEDDFDFVFVAADDQVRAAQLFQALRVACHFHFETHVLVVAPQESAAAFASALEPFDVARRDPVGELAVLSNFELP